MSADFLDSNILVYMFDQRDDRKRGMAINIIEQGLLDGSACISAQVIQESLNVCIRKLLKPLTPESAARVLKSTLLPLCKVWPNEALYLKGLQLQQRWSLSFYDALIVAAALQAGCTRLLSEDMQHGLRIETLRIENPFLA